MENTMALLNKYCNRLPCDTFTQLSVLKKTAQLPDGNYITSLVLPNNSHLRGLIQGKLFAIKADIRASNLGFLAIF